jgi:hypothetical protein
MPYIKERDRDEIHAGRSPETPGELNYLITTLISTYTINKGLSYTTANEVRGVLEEVSAEYRDRVVRPYEAKKRAENGDVYPKSLTGES